MASKSRSHAVKPLYRKVNTRARGVYHLSGGDFRHDRNTAKPPSSKMSQGKQRGLDYTPLYKFLLIKVGSDWDALYKEILPRVESPEPIFYMVAKQASAAEDYVRIGDNSYFSGLYVDEDGILQITNSEIDETTLEPACKCCTHTFNGIPFEKKHPLSTTVTPDD